MSQEFFFLRLKTGCLGKMREIGRSWEVYRRVWECGRSSRGEQRRCMQERVAGVL